MTTYRTTQQAPIGSGFGADTTASEVLEGVDVAGRLAIVTGGYSGLGLEITRALTAAGATVIVPARRPGAAQEAVAGTGAEVGELDLADLDSVAAFAQRFLDTGRVIDLVINNAAIMACPETRVGPHGWEAQFATNHLGHFALVAQLWPAIRKGAGSRVVAVSSIGHRRSGIRFEDPMFAGGAYEKWTAYGQAKTANALFARHLDRLGEPVGVRAFSLHPGGILTPLQRHLAQEEMQRFGWIDEAGNAIPQPGFKTPQAGAATATWCATSPQLEGLGGVYCEDCDIAQAVPADDQSMAGVRPWAMDDAAAERLWAMSAELTGVDLG